MIGEQKPRFGRNALFVVASSILVYGLTLLIHLSAAEDWRREKLLVDGEFIQGTHDAYHWLAGADGFEAAAGEPLARITRAFADLTGLSTGDAGFFLPAFAAGLTAVCAALWAGMLGSPACALAVGLMTALSPGFFLRTRIGYLDTDLATLLFPLLAALVVAERLGPHTRRAWPIPPLAKRFPPDEPATGSPLDPKNLLWLFAAGLFAKHGADWHGQILTFSKLLFVMGIAYAAVMAKPGQRGRLLLSLLAFGPVSFAGTPGLVLSALVCALGFDPKRRLDRLAGKLWIPAGLVAATILFGGVFEHILKAGSWMVETYVKPAAQNSSSAADALVYPGIAQSVIEAQNVPLVHLITSIHPIGVLGSIGLAGFLALLVVRPRTLFLAPFLILFLSSVKLGARMAMFGGPVVALGVAVPIGWGFFALWPKARTSILIQAGFALILALGLNRSEAIRMRSLDPSPVLTAEHAKAYKAIGQIAQKDAVIWTWWDFGYAAHYYAKRHAFADGGRHGGEHIFTLGTVLSTPFPAQAARVMKLASAMNGEPWTWFSRFKPGKLETALAGFIDKDPGFVQKTEQYLVVTYENFRLAPWITYYGTWDFIRKNGTHGRVLDPAGRIDVDEKQGLLLMDGKEAAKLASINLLDGKTPLILSFPNNRGPHLLAAPNTGFVYAVDDLVYDSLLVRLLIVKPDDPLVAPHFELVHDDAPNVRVWKLK